MSSAALQPPFPIIIISKKAALVHGFLYLNAASVISRGAFPDPALLPGLAHGGEKEFCEKIRLTRIRTSA